MALYYDYYVTPWINSSQFKIPSAESDTWSDDGEEKEQELNENFGVLFAFEPKAPIPSAESSSIQPRDIGLEEKLVEETTDRTSNLGW